MKTIDVVASVLLVLTTAAVGCYYGCPCQCPCPQSSPTPVGTNKPPLGDQFDAGIVFDAGNLQ